MKKVLSLILALTMLLMLNVGALAADTTDAVDSGITLSHTSINILVGKSFVLVPTLTPNTGWELTWTSSDPEVVTVDDKGVLTAIKAGRATVTAAGKENASVSASCTVNVVDESQYEGVPVQGVRLPHNATVRVGATKKLTAEITPANATNKTIIWTSEDENIVIMDEDGNATGVSEGMVRIRATSEDGNHWDECNIMVIGADAPAILVDFNVAPNETVNRTVSINSDHSGFSGIGYVSDYEIEDCRFEKGLIDVKVQRGGIYMRPATPHNDVKYLDKTIEDILIIKLSDGNTYTFPTVMTFDASIDLKIRVAEDGISIHKLPYGKTYNIIIDILDMANVGVQPYTVEISEEGDSGVIQIGEIVVNGKTAQVPVTPLRIGSVDFAVDIEDASQTHSCGTKCLIDVIPEGVPPVLTPGSFDKDDASDNEANSSDTLADIAAANDALATGGDLPKEVVNATTAGGATVPAIPVKLTTGSANLYVGTADLIGSGKVGLLANVNNGAMTVLLPGGFGKVNEAGRVYYPLDFESSPRYAAEMLSAVQGENAKSEAVKAGGWMTMPATVTVSLKTRLEGKVNVYLYNPETGKYTLLASPTAKDSRITFGTRQMGYMVLTTGRI